MYPNKSITKFVKEESVPVLQSIFVEVMAHYNIEMHA